MDDSSRAKMELRSHFRKLRNQLSPEERQHATYEICEMILALPAVQDAKTIAAYQAMDGEVDLSECIEKLLQLDKKIVIPQWRKNESDLTFHHFHDDHTLSPTIAQLTEIDVMLVPGVAFTQRGDRLGFGKGYYDRCLKRLPPTTLTVGVCFSVQISQSLPTTAADQKVGCIVFEHPNHSQSQPH